VTPRTRDGSRERDDRSDRSNNPNVNSVERRTAVRPDVQMPAAATRPKRLSRREAQAQTRARLLDAAAEIFSEKGFSAATIADVADRAGYTIGAVYSNFEGKDALFRSLMAERLVAMEAGLTDAFASADAAHELQPDDVDQRIRADLDRLEAAEDSVPASWGRLLNEYRGYIADDAAAKAELAELDRRCVEIIARYIERFAASIELVLPLPATELVELTNALSAGLRDAHADGRASMTSGRGLRLVVGWMIESARCRGVPTS